MKTSDMTIPARHYRLYDENKPYGCDEAEFGYVETTLTVPLEQAVLVLVDCWNTHYCPSWLARASDVMQEKIVPAVAAAREVGMPVVHAPCPTVAQKHQQSEAYADPKDKPRGPMYAEPDEEWPPQEFVKREGQHSQYRRSHSPPAETWRDRYETQDIADIVKPQADDYVVATGVQMHRMLKDRKILHLFYAGFATNMCVQYRDYGIRAMNQRGYNIILLRDCTTGVEDHDTVDELLLTRAAVREIETQYAFSAASEDFRAACHP